MKTEDILTMMEFTEIMKNEPKMAYDYIAKNYYKFKKNELVDIIKELLYGIYEYSKEVNETVLLNVSVELDERYDDLYQDT